MIVRNLVLRGVIEANELPRILGVYQSAEYPWVRKHMALALAKLGCPLVLEDMLEVRQVISDHARFGPAEEKLIAEVVLAYLREQQDLRAAEAIRRYTEK